MWYKYFRRLLNCSSLENKFEFSKADNDVIHCESLRIDVIQKLIVDKLKKPPGEELI